jgi:hypothetical protein
VTSAYKNKLSPTAQAAHPFESAWEDGFAALTMFRAREGHCRVPRSHVEGAFKLGRWVYRQRWIRDTLSTKHRQWLDTIEFVWDPFNSAWEAAFMALMMFKAREGHCRVPGSHVEGAFKLGRWVNMQRHKMVAMSAARMQQLDAIGFVWNAIESAWEERFAILKEFKAREGHCRVPTIQFEGSINLGNWVRTQRRNRDRMSSERRRRLDEIGFVWRVE